MLVDLQVHLHLRTALAASSAPVATILASIAEPPQAAAAAATFALSSIKPTSAVPATFATGAARPAALGTLRLRAHERRPPLVGRRRRFLSGGRTRAGERAVRSAKRAPSCRCEQQFYCVDWRHRCGVRGHVGMEPVQRPALVHELASWRAQ